MKGVVIAGTASGVGKTVATLAVLRALKRDGLDPRPAKAGPDFIDPSHHAAVTGHTSRTLDPWLEGREGLRRTYLRDGGDVRVVEGVMGLYDGDTSTARIAAELDLPVVLVVDAKAGMESVAATALGFQQFAAETEWDVDVCGVLAQRAHGGRHQRGIRNALPNDLTYVGRIPPDEALEIPERHLGLHMGQEAPLPTDALDRAAETIRIDALLGLLREPSWSPPPPRDPNPVDATVAVAEDTAFAFRYPTTLERLRTRGNVRTFSPVAGDDLPQCDGVYLPGGYPERFADDLANSPALRSIAHRAADGLPVLGECGGLMALAESLTTVDGDTFSMAGVLPADVTMHERYQSLDHVELVATRDSPTATAGDALRGHEFHYSSASPGRDARFAFDVVRGTGIDGTSDGLLEYRTLGTYAHVHAESGAFDTFLETLER
ncbi:MAG: cobyrinic acid a,c-diamide synthase, partial [Natronomonas sp.]